MVVSQANSIHSRGRRVGGGRARYRRALRVAVANRVAVVVNVGLVVNAVLMLLLTLLLLLMMLLLLRLMLLLGRVGGTHAGRRREHVFLLAL